MKNIIISADLWIRVSTFRNRPIRSVPLRSGKKRWWNLILYYLGNFFLKKWYIEIIGKNFYKNFTSKNWHFSENRVCCSDQSEEPVSVFRFLVLILIDNYVAPSICSRVASLISSRILRIFGRRSKNPNFGIKCTELEEIILTRRG